MVKHYTPLHVHSEYSLLDGLSSCEQICKRIEKIGSSACAISDHGSISSAVDFTEEMEESGFKPLLGCELYICMNGAATEQNNDNRKLSHQVVIAKNEEGWKDLLSLVSDANKAEHFYHKPRVDLDILGKVAEKRNLVTFSGHLGSTLANQIMLNDVLDPDHMNKGLVMAEKLRDMFGPENFFVEIQLIDSLINDNARIVAEINRNIASKLGIPCVATPDAHYCEKEDAEDQQVLICTSFKKTIPQIHRELKSGKASKTLATFFKSNNYHIPTYDEMREFHTEEELANTNLIADMCDQYSILSPPNPPEFTCPKGHDPESYLRHLCREGWKKKYSHITPDNPLFKTYGDRTKKELDIFCSIGLSSYFLIVDDILQYVRSKGHLTGVGRGSAAGCLVSNLLNITQVDPIQYGLIFERFYNAGRNSPGKISWPDIDFDIPKAAREDTVEYIRKKYGEDRVAQIITFQTLKGRAALTRVMAAKGNIPFDQQKEITKHLIDEAKVADELKDIEQEYGFSSSIIWALENKKDELKPYAHINDEGEIDGPLANVFKQAVRLEHTKTFSGKHAAGVVISTNPISHNCPMVLDNKGKARLAGFEGPYCESVGLLKLDCLAINTLDKVQGAVKMIGETYEKY